MADGTSGTKKKTGFRGTPHPGGANKFIATPEQRSLVKMAVAEGIAQETIARNIKNPRTGKPITVETLVREFKEELDTGYFEAQMIVGSSLLAKVKQKDLGSIVWWDKTRGKRFEHSQPDTSKIDPAGSNVKQIVEVIHGFPPEDDGEPE